MIKVLARQTNNTEQFCGQRKGSKFKCEHFTKFCVGLHETWVPWVQHLIFCRLFQCGRINCILKKY